MIKLSIIIYFRDVYLLDDPLSAVDAAVADHIFSLVIDGCLRGKTRIWSTHDLSRLEIADYVIVMSEGKIAHAGTYEEVAAAAGSVFTALRNKIEEEEREQ